MMALLEYNYLVKKVVFQDQRPADHQDHRGDVYPWLFRAGASGNRALYGYYPSLYTLQIFYYSACMFIFVLAISYTTCAVVIFFGICSRS